VFPGSPRDSAGSVLSVIWHRLALLGIALVAILVILPAVLGAVGNHWIGIA
jgi:preprotein translocase subunit SecY